MFTKFPLSLCCFFIALTPHGSAQWKWKSATICECSICTHIHGYIHMYICIIYKIECHVSVLAGCRIVTLSYVYSTNVCTYNILRIIFAHKYVHSYVFSVWEFAEAHVIVGHFVWVNIHVLVDVATKQSKDLLRPSKNFLLSRWAKFVMNTKTYSYKVVMCMCMFIWMYLWNLTL